MLKQTRRKVGQIRQASTTSNCTSTTLPHTIAGLTINNINIYG